MIKNYFSDIAKRLILIFLLSGATALLAQVPVVKFGASKRVVEQYESVQLFDSSTNNPYQWEWNVYDSTTYKSSGYYPGLSGGDVYSDPWGNGNNEFSKNPEFAFDIPGTYTVTLRCRNSTGWSTVLIKKGYLKCALPTQYYLGYGTYGANNDNVVESDYGTVFDNGGPNLSYGNSQGTITRSYLLIRPCHAKKIILTMSRLKFADANDVLYVYDAEKEDYSKLLAAWTKNNTSGKTVTALSGSMYLIFKSDGNGVDSGFAGAYTSELDTTVTTPGLTLIRDTVLYNSTPFRMNYSSQDIYGTPTFEWTVDGNQIPNNVKKEFRYTLYTDGKYRICLKIRHCLGDISDCDTVVVVTPHTTTKLNFKTSSTYTNAFNSVVLTPITDKANRFYWSITPKSYTLLNPPASPSAYDTASIRYNATPGDSLPRPRIRFLDSVCYTIKLIAFNSLDPGKTGDTLIKTNYVCGKDFRDVYGLYGTIYNDLNTDCQFSNTESGIQSIPVKLYDSANNFKGLTYSFENGVFGFEKTEGTFKMEMNINALPVKANCQPGVDSIITFSKMNPFNGLNFALECDVKTDLGIQSIYTSSIVFPGRTHILNVNAGMIDKWFGLSCTQPSISGSVKITIAGKVSYAGIPNGAKTPSNISGKVFTYTISDFNNIKNLEDFKINLKTDTSAQAGDTISVFVEVLPINGDKDTMNNRRKIIYLVRNSLDPNEKEVYPVNVPPSYSDWLTYTIHFQNTGNAPAFNIRLEDTLSSHQDPETFQVMDYSHPNRIALKNNILKVYFNDIMLPDSNTDKKGSMGFIQYRVKPKSNLPEGTKIRNTAYIYFDYNSPVVTNTTVNEYIENKYIRIPDPAFVLFLNNRYPTSMKGDMMDTTSTTISSETKLDVKGLGIKNLFGLQFFNSLLELNCRDNKLQNLPALSVSLVNLDCSSNEFIGLPALPNTLKTLDCRDNLLIGLPALPGTLENLYCQYNQLTSLSVLPNSLINLWCFDNLLTVLPILPFSLVQLNCANNPINSLPFLPAKLRILECDSNRLTLLPVLPQLITLDCGNNHLKALPDLPNSLLSLYCDSNQLNIIGQTLPASLKKLDCSQNLIEVMPFLHQTISTLICDDNQLKMLPALPVALRIFTCSDNQIACFPTFIKDITEIDISGNPFTCLPNHISAMNIATKAFPICVKGDTVNNPLGCDSAGLTEIMTIGLSQLIVYPNPSSGLYQVENPSEAHLELEIFNAMGVLYIKKSGSSSDNLLDLTQYPDGIYFLKMYLNGQVRFLKLLKY